MIARHENDIFKEIYLHLIFLNSDPLLLEKNKHFYVISDKILFIKSLYLKVGTT